MMYFIPAHIDINIKTNNDDLKLLSFRRHYLNEIDYQYILNTIPDKHNYIKQKFFVKNCNNSIIIQQFSMDGIHINIVISLNSFDYSRPKGMDQYLIWVDPEDISIETILVYINKYIDNKNYILWTNGSSVHSSLPQKRHYHLMIQNITPRMTLKKIIILACNEQKSAKNNF